MPEPAVQFLHDGLVAANPRWLDRPGLIHGVTTRRALPEAGKLDFFVAIRRARDRGALPALPALGADQVHEDRVFALDRPVGTLGGRARIRFEPDLPAAEVLGVDALLTSLPGQLLVIQTADCLPLLIVDFERRRVGIAHCGWRGLRLDLAGKLAREMVAAGSPPASLDAWIGPCIRAERYEVGPDLVEDFRRAFPDAPVSPDGVHLDLPAVACHQLERAGLNPQRIHDSGECTLGRTDRYHSYRDRGPEAGRMLSFVGFDAE